jgi:hypothetical protein
MTHRWGDLESGDTVVSSFGFCLVHFDAHRSKRDRPVSITHRSTELPICRQEAFHGLIIRAANISGFRPEFGVPVTGVTADAPPGN